jgi:hypothetical protein
MQAARANTKTAFCFHVPALGDVAALHWRRLDGGVCSSAGEPSFQRFPTSLPVLRVSGPNLRDHTSTYLEVAVAVLARRHRQLCRGSKSRSISSDAKNLIFGALHTWLL